MATRFRNVAAVTSEPSPTQLEHGKGEAVALFSEHHFDRAPNACLVGRGIHQVAGDQQACLFIELDEQAGVGHVVLEADHYRRFDDGPFEDGAPTADGLEGQITRSTVGALGVRRMHVVLTRPAALDHQW